MKVMKEFGYHNIGTYKTILDRVKILDDSQGPKYDERQFDQDTLVTFLLKVLRLNSQLTFIALLYRYNLTTSIVSSVVTVFLLPDLPLMMFGFVPCLSYFLRFSILPC